VSETPTLAALGLVLRPLISADAAALFVALSDAEVQLYRRGDVHASIEETKHYIEDTLARSRAAWAITADGREALGRLALRVPEPGVGEFGIVIRRTAQRRGLGLKALILAEGWAFGTLRLTRLFADVDAENSASLAVFERAGFTREAFLPAHLTTKLGRRDSVILAKARTQS
jgi:[ribosomal protein S5]-alanine N-acetyltransferase